MIARDDLNGLRSLRNLDRVHVLVPDQLNTYDVLCADDVVFTSGALDAFLETPVVTKARPTAQEAAK